MRDEKLRNTNIEVATESTIRPDVAAEKEEALEYVGAVTQFLQAAGPMAQAPVVVPLLMEMLKAATKPFKWGRQLEETMDATADALSQMAQMAVQQQMMARPCRAGRSSRAQRGWQCPSRAAPARWTASMPAARGI